VATIWGLSSGPSVDFILGGISSVIATETVNKYPTEPKEWREYEMRMFAEKNCALLE
jgi:hypothetical protein